MNNNLNSDKYWDSDQEYTDEPLASEYEFVREDTFFGQGIPEERSSSTFNHLQSFDLSGVLHRINTQNEEDLPEVPKQLENPYSLDNIKENDINNIYNQWSLLKKDLNIFCIMFLKKLGEVSPKTMAKMRLEEGTLVGGNIIYNTETLQEVRRFTKHLNRILMKLDKQEEIHHQLRQIAGPFGYFETELTKDDVECLVEATLYAIEAHFPQKLSKETLNSFEKVLLLIYNLMQDLTKWNDRSDIYATL